MGKMFVTVWCAGCLLDAFRGDSWFRYGNVLKPAVRLLLFSARASSTEPELSIKKVASLFVVLSVLP